MSKKKSGVVVVGCDPGFANVGLCALRLTTASDVGIDARYVGTKAAPKSERRSVYDDVATRVGVIADAVMEFMKEVDADVFLIERPPFNVRNIKTTRDGAAAWGAALGVARSQVQAVYTVDEAAAKKAATGKKNASKAAVQKAVMGSFGGLPWPKTKTVEHVADACAIALTARSFDLVRILIQERCK